MVAFAQLSGAHHRRSDVIGVCIIIVIIIILILRGSVVGCMKHRRKTVLDAVLPTMAEKPETFVKCLHGASSATVAALLPKLRAAKPQEGSTHPGWISGLTVKWDRLWKFHATTYS